MSYTVIARKYRPKKFEHLIGQEPIVNTLKNAISMKKIFHAYLFAGPRGVGKTSIARILSKALNCEKGPTTDPCNQCKNCLEITDGISMDVMEIDGASNRGIDEIRELKEKINYTPISSNYKVYILDEVHMLTMEAFNALLKTLEEPPEHIIFMFATTQPHKIPLTVLSRCQRFDFRRITINEISNQLKEICSIEKVKADMESLFLIAKNSDGSMRDAQSALDQLIAYSEGKINTEKVRNMFGISTSDIYHLFLTYIHENNVKKGIEFISEIYNQGLDLKLFIINFIDFLRNLFLVKNHIEDELILEETKEEIEHLKKLASCFDLEVIDEMIKYLVEILENFRYSSQFKILLEVAFFNLTDISRKITFRFLYNYIKNISGANPASTSKTEPPGQIQSSAQTENNKKRNIEQEHEKKNPDNLELWDSILDIINREKPSIASFLKNGKFIEIKDNIFVISFDNGFFFNSLNKEVKVIQDIIKDKLNKDYHFKFELTESKKVKKEEEIDPVIDKAQQIFKGKIV